jgi:hypothetical protein
VVAFVVVFVVVAVVGCAAEVVDVHFLPFLLPVPVVTAVFAVGWVVCEVGEGDPVEFDALHPFEPVSAWPILRFNLLEKGFEDERATAEEDSVVLE